MYINIVFIQPTTTGVPVAETTPARLTPTSAKVTANYNKPVNIPAGTDATVLRITIIPRNPNAPVEVKTSVKLCIKETSE